MYKFTELEEEPEPQASGRRVHDGRPGPRPCRWISYSKRRFGRTMIPCDVPSIGSRRMNDGPAGSSANAP